VRTEACGNATATAWAAAAIFVLVAAALFLVHGNRMVATNDEGILLEPAQRMAEGAAPYVDFFGYMSPGSYWLQSLVFRCFGVSLRAGRLPVILDLALQCALVFWLTTRLASRAPAVLAMLVFTGFQVANPAFLTAQHRWDSATLALAGVCLLMEGLRRKSPAWWWAGGAAMGAAAWCTPSVGFVIATTIGWMVARREHRGRLIPFAGGVALVCAADVGALAADGALEAFLRQMAWLKTNYWAVNRMSYGSMIGGVGQVLEGARGFEKAALLAALTCLELPATLPLAAIGLWALAAWLGKIRAGEGPVVTLLLLSMAALALGTYPRSDVEHLAFVAALPYALTVAGVARLVPRGTGIWIAAVPLLFSALFAGNHLRGWLATDTVASPVGRLRVEKEQLAGMERLLARVGPGQTLYVHPYSPIYYFVTQAKNPTRFSFLAPGMMAGREEAEALSQLRARPPEWLMYLRASREEFLRVFPSGTDLDHRFRALEGWLEKNYQPLSEPAVSVRGYELWQRVPAQISAPD
jgi:4-amino-4-deoxy-L-arabinose transferase-like glycosyltransferase